jgi:hypothetical protein
MLALYRALLRLRRAEPALRDGSREHFRVEALGDGALALRRDSSGATPILAVVGLTAGSGTEVELAAREIGRARGGASWEVVLATEDARYGGAGEWGGWDGETLRLAGPGAVVLRGRSDSTNQAEERE